jgi:hypothetical protein
MKPSFKTFMTNIIDYAGLFPPAMLPFGEAFERYLEHRRGGNGWMLARFVCPAARLADLGPLLGRVGADDRPVDLCVLGRGGDTPESFHSGIATDTHLMREFADQHADRVELSQYEVRLPQQGPPTRDHDVLANAIDQIHGAFGDRMLPFFETSLLEGWDSRVPEAVEAIAAAASKTGNAGLKIRCGGAEAAAFPTAAALTAAIATTTQADLPLKATQGLHHPIRHFNSKLETMEHGFLNLFVAGVLASARDLSPNRVLDVVDEESPHAFQFSHQGLAFRDLEVSSAQIAEARRTAVTSFGSCSFTEPCDDLKDIGLLV